MGTSGFGIRSLSERQSEMGDSAQKTLKYSHEPSHPKTCTCNPWCLLKSYHENLTCTLWVSNRTKHWYLVIKLLYSIIYLTFFFLNNIWSRWDIKEDILTFSLHAGPSGPSSSKKYFLVCIPWRSRWSSGWPRSWTTCRICRQKKSFRIIWKKSPDGYGLSGICLTFSYPHLAWKRLWQR